MNCDVGEVTVQSSFSNLSVTSPTSQLIIQPFHRFTYFTAHSPTLPSLYLRHISFFNPFVASPMSQLIFQPFFRFSYFTFSSLTSPSEPPTISKLQNQIFISTTCHVLILVSRTVHDRNFRLQIQI